MYVYVKWNRFAVVCSPAVQPLKHVLRLSGYSRNGGLRRRRRRV